MSPLNITVVGWSIIFILIFKIPPTIKRDRKANPVNLTLKFKMTTASEFTNPSVLLVAAPAYFEKKRFLLWRTADVRISHQEMLNSSAATQKAFSILRHGMEIMVGNLKLKLITEISCSILTAQFRHRIRRIFLWLQFRLCSLFKESNAVKDVHQNHPKPISYITLVLLSCMQLLWEIRNAN